MNGETRMNTASLMLTYIIFGKAIRKLNKILREIDSVARHSKETNQVKKNIDETILKAHC